MYSRLVYTLGRIRHVRFTVLYYLLYSSGSATFCRSITVGSVAHVLYEIWSWRGRGWFVTTLNHTICFWMSSSLSLRSNSDRRCQYFSEKVFVDITRTLLTTQCCSAAHLRT
ncbi:hypothetical protein CC86DRAFT_203170 [Ophiobolus disseminans]|uniref:Uncharacterized protein n=1 Tax=Ophiobolus disseminans TaxID=1469910 RepID=A0A6A7A4E4_9PLEO|nr:hypothetical protein CC86DRAFT_203170 [Ophiobolus disseminans]